MLRSVDRDVRALISRQRAARAVLTVASPLFTIFESSDFFWIDAELENFATKRQIPLTRHLHAAQVDIFILDPTELGALFGRFMLP